MIVIIIRRSTNLYEIQDLVVLDKIKLGFFFIFNNGFIVCNIAGEVHLQGYC